MTKKELIEAVAEKTADTKKNAMLAIDTIFDTITESLIKGEVVTINGFGIFKPVNKAERKCRNPINGKRIIVPARRAAKLQPSKALNEAMNNDNA